MDRTILFGMLYSLAARDGREDTLFGHYLQQCLATFERGLTGRAFPEIWFEMPLAGEPWCDLHMLVSHEDVSEKDSFAGLDDVYTKALRWFAAQESGVRQLALSFDVGSRGTDSASEPAVQLLMGDRSLSVAQGFLEAAGRADAFPDYRSFIGRMPESWYACYLGSFPGRVGSADGAWARVECIVGDACQAAYATDADCLREHLRRIGLEVAAGGALVTQVQEMARSPFPLELQFNVGADGTAQSTMSASVRFQPRDWEDPDQRSAIEALMRLTQGWNLADDRWEHLGDTVFAKTLSIGSQTFHPYCFPAFLKLRWRDGQPLDAKTYLLGGA